MIIRREPVPGEWYFGSICPVCGQPCAAFHDPHRGKSGITILAPEAPGLPPARVSMQCGRCGFEFSVRGDLISSFEW